MHAGQRGGGHHLLGVNLAKAGDIFRQGAGEQLDILRQVADMRPQLLFVPLPKIRTVQPHVAAERRQRADQLAHQQRFAGAGRANDAQHLPGLQTKTNAVQHRRAPARRAGGQLIHGQCAAGRRQRQARRLRRVGGQHHLQPLQGLARRRPLLPGADQLIDRPQHPADQDRSGDHHARRNVAVDRQQRAAAQHQRLQRQPHGFRPGGDGGDFLAGAVLQQQELLMLPQPAQAQVGQHPHGGDGLRIAQVAVGLLRGAQRDPAGLRERRLRHPLVEPGQQHQHDHPGAGQRAKPGVEQKNHQQINREPGRIEKGEQRIAGGKLAQVGQIVQRLPRQRVAGFQIGFEGGVVDPLIQAHIHLGAEADHHLAAHPLQQPHKQVKADHHQGQHCQRHAVARRQHTIVDLQHVQRRCQHQQVDHRGKQRDAPKSAPVCGQHAHHFSAPDGVFHGVFHRLKTRKCPPGRAAPAGKRPRSGRQQFRAVGVLHAHRRRRRHLIEGGVDAQTVVVEDAVQRSFQRAGIAGHQAVHHLVHHAIVALRLQAAEVQAAKADVRHLNAVR